MTEIRVGVNLLWLAPGEVGGSEDYCIGLLRALAAQPEARPDVRVVVYANREVALALGCPLNTALARMHEGLKRLRQLWGLGLGSRRAPEASVAIPFSSIRPPPR